MSPREYLIDRFRTDAVTLRQRAAQLRSGPPQPGPDAATSQRMAEACEDVLAMIEAIPEADDASALVAALTALMPLLDRRALASSASPPVRSVFAGAATRIREVVDAERRHQSAATPAMDDAGTDDEIGDDGLDEEIDGDEIDGDAIEEDLDADDDDLLDPDAHA